MASGSHDDIDSNGLFVALSHCWGRGPFLKTLSTNIARHQCYGGIALDTLPLTFREAIDFTRRLGLRHLWIDSLCIVQDDPQDWQLESSRMAAIYQGAYVVISASGAKGACEGLYSDAAASLLFETHVEEVKIFEQKACQQDGEENVCGGSTASAVAPPVIGEVAFRRAYAHMPSLMQRQLQTAPDLPTVTRGWIYQERLLASRVLHFGPHELHWECTVDSVCQCRDDFADEDDNTGPIFQACNHTDPEDCDNARCQIFANADESQRDIPLTTSPTVSTKPEFSVAFWKTLDSHQLTASWHRLVENYTALDLTFPKDIFPAMSGIAKTFQSVQRSAYLAGLWRSTLVPDLLWHANPPTSAPFPQRLSTWRAPSWSWASNGGPVAYINTHSGVNVFCSVEDAEVQLVGSDATGELKSGYMVLRGHAFTTPISFRAAPDGDDGKYTTWNMLQLDALQKQVANIWVDYNCCRAADLPPEVTCFLLGECSPSGAVIILILKQETALDGAGDRVYERIGIIQVSKPPSRQTSLDYWLQVFPSQDIEIKII
ncbi:hypothetical protein PWT90_02920 [Aphanocladium album]|nr:hypothetical protein PWT90_02920 [Aphanocladium album]